MKTAGHPAATLNILSASSRTPAQARSRELMTADGADTGTRQQDDKNTDPSHPEHPLASSRTPAQAGGSGYDSRRCWPATR